MTTPASKIKSRIEQARKQENWNDFDWLCESLGTAVEALEGFTEEQFSCGLHHPDGCACCVKENDIHFEAEKALTKISGEK